MTSELKISVAILAYNAEKYIKDAVLSIINQDYLGDIEIIITYDEGTTDRTLQVLDELKELLPPRRNLVILRHKHTTPFRARVYNLENFTGDYMHLFDYDNIMPPNRISKVVEHIKKTGAEFLFSNARIIDSNGHDTGRFLFSIEDPYSTLKLIRSNFIDTNTIVISRSCAKRLTDLLIKLKHRYFDQVHEDWLIALLAMKHCRVQYMDDTYILYRVHGANVTISPDTYTQLFNKEKSFKTLLAFYLVDYENLNKAERKELQKAIIDYSNLINRQLVIHMNSKYIKLFYYLERILCKIFLKL